MARRFKNKSVTCFIFGAVLASTLISFVNMITKENIDKERMLSIGNKNQAKLFAAPIVNEERLTMTKTELNKHLNIFNATNESKEVQDSVSRHTCIPYKTRRGDTLICLHPREIDMHVSGFFLKTGQYESELVGLTADVLTTHPEMSLLDLGCNIGTFTVYFAKMGIRVVGVDAGKTNLLLLSRSLSLGNLHQNVTLILNAISDRHEYVSLQNVPTNYGARFVIPSEENEKGAIKTIVLDELAFMFSGQSLFIKMDIEGSELMALNGGKQFFKTVDVRYVLMEFVFHRRKKSGKQICDFFTANRFRPYRNLERARVLDIAMYQFWPLDVLWIKE